MHRCVLDRSVLSHLCMELSANRNRRLRRVKAVCDGFDELCYEPEGVSALQSVLGGCEWLRGKIQVLRFASDVRLAKEQQASLMRSLNRLKRSQAVQLAAQEFSGVAGGPGREVVDVLDYVFRLTLLARSVTAALLCWQPRASLVRAILESESVSFERIETRNGVVGSRSVPTTFPFDRDDGFSQFEYSLFDYGDPHLFRCSVYLSHSSADKVFVRKLAADLNDAEVRVWLDEAELKPGDSLFDGIEDGLDQSEFLVVVLSPDSVRSKWVQRELQVAGSREVLGKNPKVIPILLRDCEVPTLLSDKIYADFREQGRYSESFTDLLDGLGHISKSSS